MFDLHESEIIVKEIDPVLTNYSFFMNEELDIIPIRLRLCINANIWYGLGKDSGDFEET